MVYYLYLYSILTNSEDPALHTTFSHSTIHTNSYTGDGKLLLYLCNIFKQLSIKFRILHLVDLFQFAECLNKTSDLTLSHEGTVQ